MNFTATAKPGILQNVQSCNLRSKYRNWICKKKKSRREEA
jgi:hypothetical protein